jgi:EmrB/QacA subfamily drug resistance transporter
MAPTRQAGLALLVIVLGVLIAAVDTTIVVLALPPLMADLKVGISSVIWVIIGYLLIITLLATQVGRLGDLFGRVRMYQLGFLIFVLGSLLCALSWNEASIVAFRLLQGLGGALISANSGAVIADIFPPERRGQAYGFNAIGWNIGAVLGIILGGLIINYTSWRWVFWINVPIGLIAVTIGWFVLHDQGVRTSRKLDLWGMVLLGGGIFGLAWGAIHLIGASLDPETLLSLGGGLVLLALFAWVEQIQAEPMLRLDLFRIPTMTPSLLAAFFQSLGGYATLFLLIMYLQGVRGLSPLNASLLLVPGYLIGSIVGPLTGRLADRLGPALPATAGLIIQALALLLYAQLQPNTPLALVPLISAINGLGSGAFFPANNAAVMKAAPRGDFGAASGLLRTMANLGMVFSFALAILIAANAIPKPLAFAIFVGNTELSPKLASAFTTGIHAAFYLATFLLFVAAGLSLVRTRGLKGSIPGRADR